MTREEIVNSMSLQDAIMVLKDANCYGTMDIAKSVILKALEQEPCNDCISREAVKKLKKYRFNYDTNTTIPKSDLFVKVDDIAALLMVTPRTNLAETSQDVLDKIRAEIENHCGLAKENHCRYCSYCNSVMGVREILEIIDKYKAESEGKE